MNELRVGGLTRLSTCDWPGQLVATVFCQGCPWRCPYCHNAHLLNAGGTTAYAWGDVLAFLQRRRGLLDGVVYSGGEPTAQGALPDAIEAARSAGLKVGLHTAGPYPERLAAVLPRLDWVGLDIKAPFDAYDRLTGVPGSGAQARRSLGHVLASGVAYEIRTTLHAASLDKPGLDGLMDALAALGVRNYAVQTCRESGVRGTRSPSPVQPDVFEDDRRRLFEGFAVR